MPFWVAWCSLTLSCSVPPGGVQSLCAALNLHPLATQDHLGHQTGPHDTTVLVPMSPSFYLVMAPKGEVSAAGSAGVSKKRSSASFKWKGMNVQGKT